ncbi:MAG: class I SAM-dependent methyltransferase [Cyanobacteriota bacterium]|nr:class I SAM-dependent methyltransferase [Cyanobacteriota bacterium]
MTSPAAGSLAKTATLGLRIGPSALAPHVEHRVFHDFGSFQAHMRQTLPHWPAQVQQALRLIALNGIVDPLRQQPIDASALSLNGDNYRETLEFGGCLARHRAVLLVLQELLAGGLLPPREQLELYCPEAITPFAAVLRELFPNLLSSEFLPDPDDPQRQHYPHQDLCELTLPQACVDLVLCNELFEHLYDLPAALGEIARILRPGGMLLSTCPFAYDRVDTIVKSRHQRGATPGVAAEAELLMDPEFHGDPVHPEQGSLVYQIPAWDLLDQVRQAGLSDPAIHWIAAPSYGVVGKEIPAVMVLVALRR